MKTSNKLLWIAFSIVILAIITSMIWMKIFLQKDVDIYKYLDEEKAIFFHPDSKIDVKLKDVNANLDVSGWDKDSLIFQIKYPKSENSELITKSYHFSDSTAIIEIMGYDNAEKANVKCILKVPSNCNVKYIVDGGSAELKRLNGVIEGELGGGTLKASELQGKVTLNTGGGIISIDDIKGVGKFKTGGGTVRIHNINGDFDIETGGGKINISESKFDGNVTTGGGKILLSEVEGDVGVSTGGGKIQIEESEIGGTIQTGGGSIDVIEAKDGVKVITGGGSVDLFEIEGWIEASTGGGEISASIIDTDDINDYHVDISNGGGDVYLKLPPNIGYEFDIEIETSKRKSDKYKIVNDFNIEAKLDEIDNTKVKIKGKGIHNDGTHLIKIRTNSGNIYITENN